MKVRRGRTGHLLFKKVETGQSKKKKRKGLLCKERGEES